MEPGPVGEKRPRATSKLLVLPLLALAAVLAVAQHPTLARLSHDTTADIAPTRDANETRPPIARAVHSNALRDSPLSRSAADALFVKSNLERARELANHASRRDPKDAEALFVRMEVAAMQDDRAAMLDAAIRLCDAGASASADSRVALAAVRIREAAANTPDFSAVVPRLESLLTNSQEAAPDLQAALLRAAMDGAPGLNPYAISRTSGIVTDWRIVGPLADPLAELEKQPVSPAGDLSDSLYQSVPVENFQFPDGWVRLPDYLSRHGVFYAAAHFSSLTTASWTATAEGGSLLELYVDGERVLRTVGAQGQQSTTFEATPGPHRVLLKFSGAAAPLRIAITPALERDRTPPRAKLSMQELAYLLAAADYAAADFDGAIRQIAAVPAAENSAALQFLAAQSWTRVASPSPEAARAWSRLRTLAPTALAADNALGRLALTHDDLAQAAALAQQVLAVRFSDPDALETLTATLQPTAASDTNDAPWWRRIAAHPSCQALQSAIAFFSKEGHASDADAAQAKLNGCAPESLAYPRSLAEQGRHAEAARALQQLLTAAPLNRAARLMLVQQLQLAGDDALAQRAAAEWLHIAPNAANYHRLAAAANWQDGFAAQAPTNPFYLPYRLDASSIAHDATVQRVVGSRLVLLEDHVAIAREDGSVSLYVHTATRTSSTQDLAPAIPQGAQVLTLRVLHPDRAASGLTASQVATMQPGDVLDQEYVLNYAGDGGIPEHCEAFQFVFGSFNKQVLHARFVVLTPADRADSGVVIASEDAPQMATTLRGSMLERAWEKDGASAVANGSAIVRVVEQENGWTVPSSAEHRRRIETIHPQPLPEES